MASTIDVYAAAEGCNEENMQRELAENAVWKQIQKNTFTRWCNEHLKCVNKRVAALETDLSDGLRLIALLEVLSQKKTKKYNKRPNFRQMKLENVSVALNFLEQEHIKLVSIDSKAIVDGNLKLILGLIWTLILHYSISMPMWDDEEEEAAPEKKATPKQRLLGWMQNKIPQMPVTNFKGNWQDGTALGALVDNLAPGLCPDWEDWKPEDGVNNTAEAMKLADDWLGVPQVITPEEITNPNVDELSVMTYLSQFPKAQLKPGAPLRPKTNSKKARAYGKGVEPNGCKVGVPAPFTVETHSAGHGDITVSLKDPHGNTQDLKATPNNDKLKTFAVSYFPTVPGVYEVSVTFAGSAIQKSPFKVNVDDSPTDPDSVTAIGPGLESGNVTGSRAHFEVFTAGAGLGEVDVVIENPTGCRDSVRPKIEKVNDDVYMVTYTPNQSGPHKVNITFAGIHIPKSPFEVPISLPFNPDAVWADGPGVEAEGVTVRQTAKFTVHTEKAGDGKLEVKCIGPRGVSEVVNVKDNGDGTYACDYHPLKTGQYVISVTFGGKSAANSPYRVNVDMPPDASKVKVQGPGIGTGNIINEPTYFDVLTAAAYVRPSQLRAAAAAASGLGQATDADAGKGAVDATITLPGGKGEIPVHIEDRGNGTVRVSYTPKECGIHKVKVNFAGQEIPKSPYNVEIHPSIIKQRRKSTKESLPKITPKHDASLETNIKPIKAEQPILISGENLLTSPEKPAGFYSDKKPVSSPEETIDPTSEEKASNHKKSSASSIGFGEKTESSINEAAKPTLEEKVTTSLCEAAKPTFEENSTSNLTEVTEPTPVKKVATDLSEKIKSTSDEEDTSPDLKETAEPCAEENLSSAPDTAVSSSLNFEDKSTMRGGETVQPNSKGKESAELFGLERKSQSSPAETAVLKSSPEQGAISHLDPKEKVKSNHVEASRPDSGEKDTLGLGEKALIHPKDEVTATPKQESRLSFENKVESSPEGINNIGLGNENKCRDTVTLLEDSINTCPAQENADQKAFISAFNPNSCRVYGRGIQPTGLRVREKAEFHISTKGSGDAKLKVNVKPPRGSAESVTPKKNRNEEDVYDCEYFPTKQGNYTVEVTYGGKPVPKSPFLVAVGPEVGQQKVRAYGPGLDEGKVGHSADFVVEAIGPDVGKLGFSIEGPSQAKIECEDKGEGSCDVKYFPTEPGEYAVHVMCDDVDIKGSPFMAQVAPADSKTNPDKVVARGPGLESGKPVPGTKTEFTLDARKAGEAAPVEIYAKTSDGDDVPVTVKDNGDGTYQCEYKPLKPVKHTIIPSYDGVAVKGSPFRVAVADTTPDVSKVRVYGPGLTKGTVNKPAPFTIDTTDAGDGGISLTVEGPCEPKIECIDNGDCTCSVSYLPTEPGDYKINVKFADEHVPGSPFAAEVEPAFDITKVRMRGPGLESGKVGKPSKFEVDHKKAGEDAPLAVEVTNEDGSKVPEVKVKDNGDGTKGVTFVPNKPGKAKIDVQYGGVPLVDSPITVPIKSDIDTSGVRTSGPGVEPKGVLADVETDFKVNAKCLAPRGGDHLEAKAVGPSGNPKPIDITDNEDGTYDAKYAPTEQGPNKVFVEYDGVPVPGSPFPVQVKEGCDSSKVKAYGPGLEQATTNKPAKFVVDTRGAGTGGLGLSVEGPSDAKITCSDGKDGTCAVEYLPVVPGDYQVNVTYGDENIPGSPFKVNVADVVDPTKVKCEGPGISSGVRAAIPQEFTVDCTKAGVAPLEVAVKGPRGITETVDIEDNDDGTHTVKYTPTKEGTYQVQVKYADEEVPKSPYRVRVLPTCDASKVKCTGPGVSSPSIPASLPVEFIVDTNDAGEGVLALHITNPKREKYTAEMPPASTKPVNESNIAPTSRSPATKSPIKSASGAGSPRERRPVKGGAGPVKRSPVKSGVGAAKGRRPVKEGKISPTKRRPVKSSHDDDAVSDDEEEPREVQATDPDGNPMDAHIRDNGDGTYTVEYVPDLVGRYTVSVKYGDDEIPSSPYRVRAVQSGDAGKCVASGDGLGPNVGVGEESVITVDANDAGPGKVTCAIAKPDGKPLDSEVVEKDDGTFDVFYTPHETGTYPINIQFGGEPIPDSPWKVKAEPAGKRHVVEDEIPMSDAAPAYSYMNGNESVDGPDAIRPVELTFEVPTRSGELTSEVITPSKRKDIPKIKENDDGTITVQYKPTEKGLHEMSILLDDEHISGSPIQFYADAMEPGHVTAYGPGLVTGKVNEPADFTIVTKDAGAGGLGLAIEGPSKAEITCADNQDGTCSVSYLPTAPGEYSVSVKFDDEHIAGSPFTANISGGPDRRKSKLAYGTTSDVSLNIQESDLSLLRGSIESPSGKKDDCILKKLPNGHIGISFTPKEIGEHMVSVKKRGRHVANSPFRVMVGESEIGDASKVKVYGEGCEKACEKERAEFNIDTRNAGFGGLGISVEGPSKVDIDCEDMQDGICKVTYEPQEAGNYTVNVKFADKHVPGSPFSVKCEGDGSKQKESITKQQKAAPVARVGSTCDLNVKIPDAHLADLTAEVRSPSGHKDAASVVQSSENTYTIRFVPKELGVHTVTVKCMGHEVPGSPFQFTVGPLGEGGAGKVTAHGPGLERAEVNLPAEFSISTREAGAGGLAIAVEGPSKADINFDDQKDGSCLVTYVVTEPGDYEVSVKFNDEHIPGSCFPVHVTGVGKKIDALTGFKSDASKVRWYGDGLRHAKIGEENVFTVDCGSAGSNMLLVGVHGPEIPCEEVMVKHIGQQRYTVTYTANQPGAYLLIVKWGEDHIPGSPFHVTIP